MLAGAICLGVTAALLLVGALYAIRRLAVATIQAERPHLPLAQFRDAITPGSRLDEIMARQHREYIKRHIEQELRITRMILPPDMAMSPSRDVNRSMWHRDACHEHLLWVRVGENYGEFIVTYETVEDRVCFDMWLAEVRKILLGGGDETDFDAAWGGEVIRGL